MISLAIADISINESRIIKVTFKPTSEHSLEDAKQVVSACDELAGLGQCPVIADLRGVETGANRDARDYYTSDAASRHKSAMAMVVNSVVQRLIGNIFLRINRPPYPTKIFGSMEHAEAWATRFIPAPETLSRLPPR